MIQPLMPLQFKLPDRQIDRRTHADISILAYTTSISRSKFAKADNKENSSELKQQRSLIARL